MQLLITLITLSLLTTIALGIWFELFPLGDARRASRWFKGSVAANAVVFVGATAALLMLGMQDVLAQTAAGEGAAEITEGLGLALIGIGIPTGLAAIGAGIAVGPVGAASLAIISEKPEMFGRTLIYLGLAEGIAIYGLVVTILLLGKIG